jgi:hypothetical protein
MTYSHVQLSHCSSLFTYVISLFADAVVKNSEELLDLFANLLLSIFTWKVLWSK